MANSWACELIVTESLSDGLGTVDENFVIKCIIRDETTGDKNFDQIIAASKLDTV